MADQLALFAGVASTTAREISNLPIRVDFHDNGTVSVRLVGEKEAIPEAAFQILNSLAAFLKRSGLEHEVMECRTESGKRADMIVVKLQWDSDFGFSFESKP